MLSKLILSIIRLRVALAVFGLLVLAAAYPVSTRLQTDQSVSSLFGNSDPTLLEYQKLKQWFGKDDVLVLMYRDDQLATPAGIDRSRKLTQTVKALPGVTATLSPSVLNRAAEGMSGPGLSLLGLGGDSAEKSIPKLMRPDDPVGRGLSEIFAGYTHSTDYTRAAVVAMIQEQDSAGTVERLKDLAQQWSKEPGISEVSLVGEPVLVDQAFALVRRDGKRLAWVTVLLLSVVVMASLLDARLVLLLGLSISWSVIVTKATMYSLGISLSLIASILVAIVTVVSVTAVLHLGVRYHSRRGRGFTQEEASLDVFQSMALPIFWTCATDAAGFAALWFSQILPVRQFGLMVALASLCVFVSLVLFAPTCLALPEFGSFVRASFLRRNITRTLRRLCLRFATLVCRYRVVTVGLATIAMLTSVIVVTRSETETSFLRNFRDDSSIVINYGNVENNLGGAGVWDLILDVPVDITNESLDQVRAMERNLIDELGGDDGLSKAISLADATEVLGQSTAGKFMSAPVRIAAMRTRLPTFIGALISPPLESDPSRRKLRVMLRSPEGLSAQKKHHLIAGVQRIAEEHSASWETSSDRVRATTTGYYVIMTRLVDQLVADQWRCFAASAALIWILMSLATGSLRLATAALLPNLLPAFVVLATVSITGGKVNMGAAMIAAVSVGLSIDGSVHLLTAYRRRRQRQRNASQASISAAGNIGAPVVLATIALVAGFSVLSTSEFIPTATFGTLVAWTLVIGTLINLSVLPALIQVMLGRSRKAP